MGTENRRIKMPLHSVIWPILWWWVLLWSQKQMSLWIGYTDKVRFHSPRAFSLIYSLLNTHTHTPPNERERRNIKRQKMGLYSVCCYSNSFIDMSCHLKVITIHMLRKIWPFLFSWNINGGFYGISWCYYWTQAGWSCCFHCTSLCCWRFHWRYMNMSYIAAQKQREEVLYALFFHRELSFFFFWFIP